MTAIGAFMGAYFSMYCLLSVLNVLFITAGCVCVTAALFRVRMRRNVLFWALSLLLCVGAGVLRPLLAGTTDGNELLWSGTLFAAPFLCAALLFEAPGVWKALIVTAGYTMVEGAKYLILLIVYRYDSANPDDPFELAVEFVVDALFFLAAAGFLLLFPKKHALPSALEGIGPGLYLLICLTVGVFVTSLVLFGRRSDEGRAVEFGFLLLNIPLFAATIACSISTIVKDRVREENYKSRIEMQVQHYEMMRRMDEELRIFRHDLPKMLRPAAAYIDSGEPERAKELLERLGSFKQTEGTRFHTGNAALDTVLFCEDQIARQSGSRIIFPFGGVFPAEGIEPDDIYTIFPNALDNAIEACRKTGNPCEITVASKIVGDTVYVSVKNPAPGAVEVKNGMPVTTKQDKRNHGYGFRSIKKAAAKYGEDNVEFSVADGVFELMVSLKF